MLREASTKVVSNEPVKQEDSDKNFDWNDQNYCDKVLSAGKPKKIEQYVVPGENKAHKQHCHSVADGGGCTKMCSILEQIDKKTGRAQTQENQIELEIQAQLSTKS